MPSSTLVRAISNHQAMLTQVRSTLLRETDRRYRALGSYRDADAEKFVASVAPLVEAGQKRVSQLTQGHMDLLARAAGLTPSAAIPVQFDLRSGVTTKDVYARPFQTVWWKLSEGADYDAAVEMGAQRLSSLVATDLQLAQSFTANEKLRDDQRVAGWQRVLGDGESCALCAIASTQRYSREDLLDIHDNCRCSVEPIYGNSDPGQVVNSDRLDSIKEALSSEGVNYADGQFKSDRNIRVNLDGEIGPVLTWEGQRFTGVSDLPDAAAEKYLTTVTGEKIPASDTGSYWVSTSGRVYKTR